MQVTTQPPKCNRNATICNLLKLEKVKQSHSALIGQGNLVDISTRLRHVSLIESLHHGLGKWNFLFPQHIKIFITPFHVNGVYRLILISMNVLKICKL